MGCVGVPAFALGLKYISRSTGSDALMMAWAVVAFAVPVALATMDFALMRERGFGIHVSRDDFSTFYVPSAKRVSVVFVSAAASMLLLTWLGVSFG